MAFTTLMDDEFYYGRRQLIDYDRTAQPTYGYEPLTPADFLDPQEHDTFSHSPRHDADVQRLYAIFRFHYRVNPLVAVFTGIKICWAQAGWRNQPRMWRLYQTWKVGTVNGHCWMLPQRVRVRC
ncbi:MAG: hypothetical protein R2867_09820 [Caldilineaceae bacterium]